jgi:hypothetical protein
VPPEGGPSRWRALSSIFRTAAVTCDDARADALTCGNNPRRFPSTPDTFRNLANVFADYRGPVGLTYGALCIATATILAVPHRRSFGNRVAWMGPSRGGRRHGRVARARAPLSALLHGYLDRMKWTVVVTEDVPNLVLGQGSLEDSALGLSAVLESNRGGVQRQVTLTVEAADELEARRVAEEQLTSGLGAELSGVPQIESIRVEPDE